MEQSAQLDLCIQTLKDIANPVGMLQRILREGESFNSAWTVRLSNDASFLKELAIEALRKIIEE